MSLARSVQPFTAKAAAVFLVTGAGLYFYFQNEKKKIEERKSMWDANPIHPEAFNNPPAMLTVAFLRPRHRTRGRRSEGRKTKDWRAFQAHHSVRDRIHRAGLARQAQSGLRESRAHPSVIPLDPPVKTLLT